MCEYARLSHRYIYKYIFVLNDDDCFYYYSWRNYVVIAFGTLSSFIYMYTYIYIRTCMYIHILFLINIPTKTLQFPSYQYPHVQRRGDWRFFLCASVHVSFNVPDQGLMFSSYNHYPRPRASETHLLTSLPPFLLVIHHLVFQIKRRHFQAMIDIHICERAPKLSSFLFPLCILII